MNPYESVPIAANLFLVSVSELRFPEQDRLYPSLVDCNALDPVRRDGALDDGMLSQHLQHLG